MKQMGKHSVSPTATPSWQEEGDNMVNEITGMISPTVNSPPGAKHQRKSSPHKMQNVLQTHSC